MSEQRPGLWTYYSEVLYGFYASEVTVAALDREEAVKLSVAGALAFVDERIRDLWSFSFRIPSPDQSDGFESHYLEDDAEDYAEMRTRLIMALQVEAEEKIQPVASGALIIHHSG